MMHEAKAIGIAARFDESAAIEFSKLAQSEFSKLAQSYDKLLAERDELLASCKRVEKAWNITNRKTLASEIAHLRAAITKCEKGAQRSNAGCRRYHDYRKHLSKI